MRFKNIAIIASIGTILHGKRWTQKDNDIADQMISKGEADVAMLSLSVAGTGLNCQKLDTIVFMQPTASGAVHLQALCTVPNAKIEANAGLQAESLDVDRKVRAHSGTLSSARRRISTKRRF
jgi:hypothetical protein